MKTPLSLGVCNGCQFISTLAEIIPGAENWPRFVRNKSERFEARAAMVKINDTNSYGLKAWQVHICRLRFLMVKVA